MNKTLQFFPKDEKLELNTSIEIINVLELDEVISKMTLQLKLTVEWIDSRFFQYSRFLVYISVLAEGDGRVVYSFSLRIVEIFQNTYLSLDRYYQIHASLQKLHTCSAQNENKKIRVLEKPD